MMETFTIITSSKFSGAVVPIVENPDDGMFVDTEVSYGIVSAH